MTKQATILLVEDSPSLASIYQQYLRGGDYQVQNVTTGQEAQAFIDAHLPHVVLLDLKLPDMPGMEVLRKIYEQQLPIEVVIITAHGTIDSAVDAMRYGAFDYLVKPFDAKRLQVTLANALEHWRLKSLVETYQEGERTRYQGFIGASLSMQAVYRIIDSAAPSKATVFITGESGTGKEVCAQAIHDLSPRRGKPLIALNCAAIPRDLMESEIFGHVKGAFSGAVAERKGAASQANGGTLFLDEIGEMELDLQSKLLRFLQTGSFQPVGGNRLEQVDVRIVCATNRDPLEQVRQGQFREDLYYRLHVIPVFMPPLREREHDVLLLAEHFLASYASEEGRSAMRLSAEVKQIMLDYAWPGNVRELQNIIRQAVVLNRGDELLPDMLPPAIRETSSTGQPSPARTEGHGRISGSSTGAPADIAIRPLWLLEKEAIEQAIERTGGNIPKAAALLDVSPSTIYRKRQAWENTRG